MPLPNEIETDIRDIIKMDDELARANLTAKKALWNRSNVLLTLKDHCQKSYDEIKFDNDKEYIILLHIEIKGNIDSWNKTQALLNRVVGSNVVRTVTETNTFKKRKADRDNGLQFYKVLFSECFGHAIYKVFNQLFLYF